MFAFPKRPESKNFQILLVEQEIPEKLVSALLFHQALVYTRTLHPPKTTIFVRSQPLENFPLDVRFQGENQSWQNANIIPDHLKSIEFAYPENREDFCQFLVDFSNNRHLDDFCLILQDWDQSIIGEKPLFATLAFVQDFLAPKCSNLVLIQICAKRDQFERLNKNCQLYTDNVWSLKVGDESSEFEMQNSALNFYKITLFDDFLLVDADFM